MKTIFNWVRFLCKLFCQLFISRKHLKKHFKTYNNEPRDTCYRYQPKPPWVKDKVLYLKAHLPNYGCRKITVTFNRIYADKNISISKSTVYSLIKKHNYEINRIRQTFKRKKPKPLPNNLMWQMDLTQVEQHKILGVIDSGSRVLLLLKNIKDKSTITLLELLLKIIKQYGKPSSIKTDNEPVFVSRLFRLVLWVLGIKYRRTQIASPWQNGKIERLFKTMKQSFVNLDLVETQTCIMALHEFRFFYNHIRPHQYIDDRTPAEVWNNQPTATASKPMYYQGLGGNVAGFYFRK